MNMIKDRVQEEYPEFDFNGAKLNGNVPGDWSLIGGTKNGWKNGYDEWIKNKIEYRKNVNIFERL